MVTFLAHLSVTIKRLTRYKQKSSFGRHVGGQEYALQHGRQYKSYYFAEKSKCHKISPLNAFPLKFPLKIIFMHSVNFWHQQDSNSLFKGSIGHMTSYLLVQVAYSFQPAGT